MQLVNIISNNCAGAELYTRLKLPFNNPFMWAVVFADDMIKLITNFDTINWTHLSALFMSEQLAKYNNYTEFEENIPGLRIDNTFDIYFTHYKYDALATQPTTRGIDVFFNKNWEYALIKYFTRVKRMCNGTVCPRFLILAYRRHGWTAEKIRQLLLIRSKYKICLITDIVDATASNGITIINEPDLHKLGKLGPGQIVDAYYSKLIEWIH